MSMPQDPAMLLTNISLGIVGFLTIFLFRNIYNEQKDQGKSISKLETLIAVLKTQVDQLRKDLGD